MSYPSGQQGYYSGGYGDGPDDDDVSLLPRYMALAVLVLGLASYLLTFGPMPDGVGVGWGVRFAVLAALLAGFGLIPRQSTNHKVVAALAVAGFLEALATVIGTSGAGWAMTVIVVLNGLQSVAAVCALLQAHPAADADAADQAYAAEYWAQMRYYGQHPEAAEAPEGVQGAGQGNAEGQGQGQGQSQARAAAQGQARGTGVVEAQQAGYGDFFGNQDPERTTIIDRVPAQPEPQVGQAGLPNAGQARTQAPTGSYGDPQGTSVARPPGAR